MKLGIAVYHKNIHVYQSEWITKCMESIMHNCSKCHQYGGNDFAIVLFELDYGGGPNAAFFKGYDEQFYRHISQSHALPNYAAAMNYVYDKLFFEYDCDVVANINVDDYYNANRFIFLLDSLEIRADIASSNYILIGEQGQEIRRTDFTGLDVETELARGNNIVSNPCHMMKRRVFEKLQFNPDLVPVEDLEYWQRCLKEKFRIFIAPEYLHYYRVHPKQSGNFP